MYWGGVRERGGKEGDGGETYDFGEAVDGAAIETLAFVGGVLHLKARFYVLYRPGDEGYGPAGHDASEGVAGYGEFLLLLAGYSDGVEDVVV